LRRQNIQNDRKVILFVLKCRWESVYGGWCCVRC